MKEFLKNNFSRNRNISVIFVVVIITIIATFVLSYLISSEVQHVGKDIAKRSFQKKYDLIGLQFQELQKPLLDVAKLVPEESRFTSHNHSLALLSELQLLDSTVRATWYYTTSPSGINHLSFKSHHRDSNNIKAALLKDTILPKNGISSTVIQEEGSEKYLWRNSISIPLQNETLHYGYDLDVMAIQKAFWDIDNYSSSYAYVFNKDGICLLHPDTDNIGKNVFSFTPLSPQDTTIAEDGFSERLVQSEFLQLDVISFIKPLHIGGEEWYIAVNYPKSLNEENIGIIKKYSYTVYFTSALLLLFVFFYFNKSIKKEYKAIVLLQEEKSRLAIEKEVFQKESAFLQLQQLKNQINPHFLFNSLNSLYTLIDQDVPLSKKFTFKLSKIYRYLISPPQQNIISLSDEMDFIKEYLFLQKTRFNTKLQFHIDIDDQQALRKKIPYLALQTVVENAIKHNIATKEHPLLITIHILNKVVIVKNTLQVKENPEKGLQFGLQYLESIYGFYKNDGVKTYKQDSFFICELPLL
ncbi:histidine kinase [Arenibacter sp. 6A1]|uniref:histidine kinase n=1 Tax=Arenibacter sp. 6A1 TaxID=2720391 RepID=UPI0014484779|nr:histidine kinase [Arenibacter sp. 6A1]NKI27000.1 histidine kinase [Arenibacter sp. 6A1]